MTKTGWRCMGCVGIMGLITSKLAARVGGIGVAFAVHFVLGAAPLRGGVASTLLEDFESGGTHSAAAVTTANSAASSGSNSSVANVADAGSKRLRLTDSDGGTNGCVLTFTNVLTAPGNYLFTAEVKVDNASTPIGSFGMGLVLGAPAVAEARDPNGGYVMNLSGSGDAVLGYQTIGAAIRITTETLPQSVSLYFSTNPTGNDYSAPSTDGRFRNNHRTATSTWAAGSSNAVYIDNIRVIGPGNAGEDRHYWVSAGNNYNNLALVQQYIDIAQNNHFNCIDILARFRSDAYYVPNRNFSTFPNPEPYGTLVGGGTPAINPQNDPLQYLIDHCPEQGLKAYISFSCFLATPNDTYPSHLPTGSQTWIYNGGSPRAQVSADSGEGVWADVGRADVRTHLINVMRDIVQNYDVDGVIFDRIRYEHNDYGYNPTALSELGIVGTPTPTNAAFLTARRNAVTTFLRDAYEAATDLKPWTIVGTVPIIYFTSFSDTYHDVLQFWPGWTAAKTRNRAFSFGAEDCIQPQAYRSGATYGPYNTVYLDLGRYGDLASYSLDYGLMPGANVNFCPLFYHPTTGDSAQSLLNAQNVCDATQKECNGSGIYSADTVRTDIRLIRKASTTPCGNDAFASSVPNADFLMKANYDNTGPNPVTGLIATPTGSLGVNLSWTAPSPAADGEGASRYLVYRSTLPGVREYYAMLRNKATTVTATSFADTVPGAGTYYYSVVAVDDYNNRSTPVETGPVAATGAAFSSTPSAPTNIRVAIAGNVAYVTWNDNSGIETAFELQRDSVTIATLPDNLSSYKDNDVAAGSHTYRVRAVNSFGNSSYVTASVVTAANTVAAPSSLAAVGGAGSVSLTWTDTPTNESGTEILRATSLGGPFVQVASIGPDLAAYTDFTVTSGTYYYKVRSYNGAALSLFSNQVSAAVGPPSPPAAPTGLSASTTGSGILLSWTDNSSNESGFEIYRATVSGGPYALIQTTAASVTMYTDLPGASGHYYYVVRAVNPAGNSAFTNEAGAIYTIPTVVILESRQPGGGVTPSPTYEEFITTSGTWGNTTAKSAASGLTGSGGRYTGDSSLGSYVIFTPTLPVPGYYDVHITCPGAASGPNVSSPGAIVTIRHNGVDYSTTVDLVRTNAAVADTWYLLGSDLFFSAGTSGNIKIYNNNAASASTGSRFNIDAVKFTFKSAPAEVSRWEVY
ncbi:MAG: family 10 glycosylhydrolase [Candidatus Sumerlaeaceae bacterium]|nr:family 10 glycosylhydrolase [Candidatus Sumerlaeaceae bacterium]